VIWCLLLSLTLDASLAYRRIIKELKKMNEEMLFSLKEFAGKIKIWGGVVMSPSFYVQ